MGNKSDGEVVTVPGWILGLLALAIAFGGIALGGWARK